MRLSRELVNWYAVAMADDAWAGHYEFTLPTSALAAGARIEDLGSDGPFTPPDRRGQTYVGKTPAGTADDLTFAFRPVRPTYFHEAPEQFDRPGLLYHPVKPGVRAWTKASKNRPAEPPRVRSAGGAVPPPVVPQAAAQPLRGGGVDALTALPDHVEEGGGQATQPGRLHHQVDEQVDVRDAPSPGG